MTITSTPGNFQETLWRGDFGNAYVDRNSVDPAMLAARTASWSEILKTVAGAPPASILEVGANIGLNLRALRRLSPAAFYALEPNEKARARLVADQIVEK